MIPPDFGHQAVRLLGPRETRDLLVRHGIRPRGGLGQHFVTDPNTVRKVVRLADLAPGARVIEVGPGLGALTLALVEAGAEVTCVEQDRALAPALEAVLAGTGVRIVYADALDVEMRSLTGGRSAALVANLPYSIATPLLLRTLTEAPEVEAGTIMVQREAGERIGAGPGETGYGGVSVKVAALAEARILSGVSRRVFYPEPGVDSVIVGFRRRPDPPGEGERRHLFAVVEAAFAQRRKTIRNALRGAGLEQGAIERALARAEIPGAVRAEALDLAAFRSLAAALPPVPRREHERRDPSSE